MAGLRARDGSLYLVNNLDVEILDISNLGTVLLASCGTLTFADAVGIVAGTTTGLKIGGAEAQKLGFWNVTPVVRPGALTQTYTATSATHPNMTAVAPATVAAVTVAAARYGYNTAAQADAIALGVLKLVDDVVNIKKFVNKLTDQLQSTGLLK